MTVKELHEKFDRCCKEGIPFEYECLWDGYEAVRHTDLGYPSYSSTQKPAAKESGKEIWKKDEKAGKGKGEKQGKGKYGGKDYSRRSHAASDWESYPYGWYDDRGNWHELRGNC